MKILLKFAEIKIYLFIIFQRASFMDILKKIKEYSSTTPMDFYSKYKLIAEQKYAKSDINFKIVRLGNIYNGKKTGLVKS